MTTTFTTMVEAMDAELKRQAREGGGHADQDVVGHTTLHARQLHGTFDLEKVARAGLEAIKMLPDATLDAAKWKTDLFPAQIDQALQAVVDVILGDKP